MTVCNASLVDRSTQPDNRTPPGLLRYDTVSAWAEEQREQGLTVGFTCGAFGIPHAGHFSYLEKSRRLCDRLIVAAKKLVARFCLNRRPLPAIALCFDGVVLTACGKDFDYDQAFARQVEALGTPGHVALAISTSGRSLNVVLVLKTAQLKKLKTILLPGRGKGPASEFAELGYGSQRQQYSSCPRVAPGFLSHDCEMIDEAFSRAF